MPLRFILRHRVVICQKEEVKMLIAICTHLNISLSEISRGDGEIMVMMSDEDVQTLKEYNERTGHIPASWDGG